MSAVGSVWRMYLLYVSDLVTRAAGGGLGVEEGRELTKCAVP